MIAPLTRTRLTPRELIARAIARGEITPPDPNAPPPSPYDAPKPQSGYGRVRAVAEAFLRGEYGTRITVMELAERERLQYTSLLATVNDLRRGVLCKRPSTGRVRDLARAIVHEGKHEGRSLVAVAAEEGVLYKSLSSAVWKARRLKQLGETT